MALAYTAPNWVDGEGQGLSASALQSISDCIEGLVQGTDKAVHDVEINGSTITLVYADGTRGTYNAVNLKGIVSVSKSSEGRVDTYTILFTDGTTFQFDVRNGRDGSGTGDMAAEDYDPDGTVINAGGIAAYVDSRIIEAIEEVY